MNTSLKSQKLSISKNVALGIAQIFLWGGSFFILSVLAEPIMKETGWSHTMVYGALSMSLLVSGLLSPRIGKTIYRSNTNFIFLYSGIVMASGLIILGLGQLFWVFVLGWIVIGVAMGMGLYDALFASLGKRCGVNTNQSIVQITLISGFAPTVSWFIVSHSIINFGWRNACFIYAITLLVAIFPIHLLAFGSGQDKVAELLPKGDKVSDLNRVFRSKIFYLVHINFTIGAILMTGISIYLIEILLSKKMTIATAISIGALLGPSQVGVRILDLISPNRPAIKTAIISSIAILIGLLLFFLDSNVAFLGVIIFGLGNGMRAILKGTLPLSIFGQESYGMIIGKLAQFPLIAQALTPLIGGFLIQNFSISFCLYTLCLLALINIVFVMIIQKLYHLNP